MTAFWRTLVESERVFDVFRARFTRTSSPVHLFWGALDLALLLDFLQRTYEASAEAAGWDRAGLER